MVPAVVVAAPASGSGKTTVATGLMGALREAGHTVAPFKVGPDFIDPGYHALAAGRPGRNLDPVLVGEQLIGPLYAHGAAGADIAVIEGVMGLFDGRIEPAGNPVSPAAGSTAHVAGLLGAPVILVVDARGQSHSIAALLHGFSTFDTATRIAGVILNRVGSARHEQVLRQACEHAGVPVLGAIPRAAELELPSRHLGLVTAVEHGRRARLAVEAMTALVARHVDLAAVVGGRAQSGRRPGRGIPLPRSGRRPGGARHGGDGRRARPSASATPNTPSCCAPRAPTWSTFDPLTDTLPDGTEAVLLPGGFPEQFTAELSANDVVRQQISELAARRRTGARRMRRADLSGCRTRRAPDVRSAGRIGAVHPAPDAGLSRRRRGGRFGAVCRRSSAWSDTNSTAPQSPSPTATSPPGSTGRRSGREPPLRDGAVHAGVHASYLHTHPAATPDAVVRFVAHAASRRDSRADGLH